MTHRGPFQPLPLCDSVILPLPNTACLFQKSLKLSRIPVYLLLTGSKSYLKQWEPLVPSISLPHISTYIAHLYVPPSLLLRFFGCFSASLMDGQCDSCDYSLCED